MEEYRVEQEEVKGRRSTFFKKHGSTIVVVVSVLIVLGAVAYLLIPQYRETGYLGKEYQGCSVLGINVHGGVYTYLPALSEMSDPIDGVASENVVFAIREAEKNDDIKGVMIEIDSGGGSPVAGEEIANALRTLTKPSVVVIRQIGASAAYWAATGAQHIIASENSDIGSIGVTASYILNTDPRQQYVGLTSGKYKDTGSPDKPLSADERALITRDLNIVHQNFIKAVATNRGLEVEAVKSIADGSTVLGARALELGLIDEIGGWREAQAYLEAQIGETPTICWE